MAARARRASSSSESESERESGGSSFASLSTDSELSSDSQDETTSPRRARATRAPRHRSRSFRKARDQGKGVTGMAVLLPSTTPLSTSLWTTREKQFEKFRSSLLAMPVPDGVTRIDKAKGFSLHVMSVLNWVLPDSLLHASALPASSGDQASDEDEDEEPLITLGVHVSLFHSTSKRFFGNTWVSPELVVDPFQIKQARHSKDGSLRYVIENAVLNFRAYFVSDVVDASCVGVLELVAYEKDVDSKATVRVTGCGWTLLPLFARQSVGETGDRSRARETPSAFDMNTSGDSANVFTGSPRALWELDPTEWNAQEKYDSCKFYYQLSLYEPMLSIAMFVRKNELVGALDPIPGLKNGNLANIDVGKNPKLLLREEPGTTYEEALATFVKMASLLPKTVQLEEPFELNVVATRVAIHLREEIEANLVARLKISRKAIHEGASSVEGEVSARVLKIALHNGRCFRTRQHTVPLKADPKGGDTLRCIRNTTKLRGFVCHANVAIIIVLQYTVHFRLLWPPKLKQQALEAKKALPPEEDVLLVTMGARALVPSDGKKLYLYDRHHHATAISAEPLELGGMKQDTQEEQRRVLHVDLLSGAPCRPYSDNILYTPPDQVGRLLQNRDLSTKDSFAFCDLKILLAGETATPEPKPSEEIAAADSPAKPSEQDNQTAEGSPKHAADQWARKLLGKADNNSVLAETLNALASATPETNQQVKDVSEERAPALPSPGKKLQPSEVLDSAPMAMEAPTAELSRASKTLLTRYGYMDSHVSAKQESSSFKAQSSHDKTRKKMAERTDRSVKSLQIELDDVYKANEIRFHFAAYRACNRNAGNSADGPANGLAPRRVYFTFQFYNFAPTRTEALRLSKAFNNGAAGDIQTFLLMRERPANKPSLAIQFDVDTTPTLNPLEPRRFADYLLANNLYVDVWDADSLFQIGTFAIPLHELLRQGSGVKKFQAEVEIAPPIGWAMTSGHATDEDVVVDLKHGAIGSSANSVGRIQLLMSNYGLKGENTLERDVSAVANPLQSANSTVRPGETPKDNRELQSRQTKHRVRARPLVDSNEELYHLLSQEGFYGDRPRGGRNRDSAARRKRDMRGASDATSLTPKEVDILCDLFDSRKTSTDRRQRKQSSRSTRIRCDMESKTGLVGLLSLKPPELAPCTVEAADKPSGELTARSDQATQQQIHQQSREQAQEQSQQTIQECQQPNIATLDHGERLKRVMALAAKHQVGIANAFAQFDTDKNGVLSRDEFVQAMRSLGTVFVDLSDQDLALLGDLMDSNKDGKIVYGEFSTFLGEGNQPAGITEGQWRDRVKRVIVRAMEKGIRVHHVFAQMDTSRDGKLSLKEFERGLHQLGISPEKNKANVKALLAELDKDHDGTVSYVEFLASLGISIEENKCEVIEETVKDIEEDVREILKRLSAQGVRIEDVFQNFDADGNGVLTVVEFTTALNKLLQLDETDGEGEKGDTLRSFERDAVHAFVRKINADGDSTIDYGEFVAAFGVSRDEANSATAHFNQSCRQNVERKFIKLVVRARASGMNLQDIFQQFDSNADGTISQTEFQMKMEELFLSHGLAAEDVALIAARFDTNGDSVISRQEFQAFGAELHQKLQALVTLFMPHLEKVRAVDPCPKLPRDEWTAFCEKELGLTRRKLDDSIRLVTYFGLVDEDGNVNIPELCTLCQTVDATSAQVKGSEAKGSITQSDAIIRLQALLEKARDQGVSVEKSFAHFDADSNGEITRDELRAGLLALECFNDMDEQDLDPLLESLDADGNNKITLREFKALLPEASNGADGKDASTDAVSQGDLMAKLKALLQKAVEKGMSIDACFAHFDKDGDGKIKKDGFMAAIGELGLSAEETTAIEVIEFLDLNGSGTISLAEFRRLFPKDLSEDASESESAIPEVASEATKPEADTIMDDVSKQEEEVPPLEKSPGYTETPRTSSVVQSAQEKLIALLQHAEDKGVAAKEYLALFGANGSGKVASEEFVSWMKKLPGFESVKDEEMLEIVKELDKDESGGVSLKEFKVFLQQPSDSAVTPDPENLASARQKAAKETATIGSAPDTAEEDRKDKDDSVQQPPTDPESWDDEAPERAAKSPGEGKDDSTVAGAAGQASRGEEGAAPDTEEVKTLRESSDADEGEAKADDSSCIAADKSQGESPSTSSDGTQVHEEPVAPGEAPNEIEADLPADTNGSESVPSADDPSGHLESDIYANPSPDTPAEEAHMEKKPSTSRESRPPNDIEVGLPTEDKGDESVPSVVESPDHSVSDIPANPVPDAPGDEDQSESKPSTIQASQESPDTLETDMADGRGDESLPPTAEATMVTTAEVMEVETPNTLNDKMSKNVGTDAEVPIVAADQGPVEPVETKSTTNEEEDSTEPTTAETRSFESGISPDQEATEAVPSPVTEENDSSTPQATVVSSNPSSNVAGPAEQSSLAEESVVETSGTAVAKDSKRKPPLRSASFSKRDKPESAAAAARAARRAKTDPDAVRAGVASGDGSSGGSVEGQTGTSSKVQGIQRQPSFAAARAAKRAEMAASQKQATGAASTNEGYPKELSKFRTLLRTAVESGVPVQQSFDHFDKKRTGVLSYAEFSEGLRELGPDFAQLSGEAVAAMANALDRRQQGEIHVEDFESLTTVSESNAASEMTETTTEDPPSTASASTAPETRRPPPLRRSISSKTAAKKVETPSTRSQSARTAAELGSDAATPRKPLSARAPATTVQPAVAGQEAAASAAPNDSPTMIAHDSATPAAPEDCSPSEAPAKSPQSVEPGLDCNYAFHTDPEVRAVELKLRRAALDAYSRGVLPLRVVSKFLGGNDDRRERLPGDTARLHPARRELLRVEFLQVLMELGFSLLSDTNDDIEGVEEPVNGGLPRPVTRMNDHLYARQLERLSRYKQQIQGEETRAHRQLVRAAAKSSTRHGGRRQPQLAAVAQDSLRRFADEKTQLLRVLGYYRDGHKKALVYSLLREQVTSSLTVFASFGELVFLELPFANPYNHLERFRIQLLPPASHDAAQALDLAIVRSADEWRFYRQHVPLAYGDFGTGSVMDVEQEMIDDQDEVVLEAHDRLQIPLRLRWLDTTERFAQSRARVSGSKSQTGIPVSVVLKSCSHGHTAALFQLTLRPQPLACHRVLRFSHPAASIWRATLRFPRDKTLVCVDPSVAVELLRDGLASFKCRVGEYPALESFYIVLYDDDYCAHVHEVWQLRIQAKLRVDLHAVLGQSVRHELVVRGDSGAGTGAGAMERRVQCFVPPSHRHHMQFRPTQAFALVPRALNRIEFAFCAVERHSERQVVLVNLVDVETRELVGAWSVHVTLTLPPITKTYELQLPAGRTAQKKLAYANPWAAPQRVVLRSSAPELMTPREPVLQLAGNAQTFLRLLFAARELQDEQRSTQEAVYLFVNDHKTGQNEECLLFQLTYE